MDEYTTSPLSDDNNPKRSVKEAITTFCQEHKAICFMAVILAIIAIIATVQALTKPKYDVFIMYAGPTYAASADVYGGVTGTVSDICAKTDDKEIQVSFSTIIYVPPHLAEKYEDDGIYYNGAQNADAITNFNYALAAGDYNIIFIDKTLYETTKDLDVFVPLSELGISSDKAIDEFALALHGTELAARDGFSALPDDTVAVMRKYSFIQGILSNKKTNQKQYELQKEYFCMIAEYLK